MKRRERREHRGRRAIEITGRRFGRLVVEQRHGSNKHGQALWVCRCRCGGLVRVASYRLRYGRTRSCGCKSRPRQLPVFQHFHRRNDDDRKT